MSVFSEKTDIFRNVLLSRMSDIFRIFLQRLYLDMIFGAVDGQRKSCNRGEKLIQGGGMENATLFQIKSILRGYILCRQQDPVCGNYATSFF